MIRDALAQTPATFKLLASILHLWCSKTTQEFKVVDDQIAFESLKLLHIIAKSHNAMSQATKEAFLNVIKEDNWLLVSELRDKGQQTGPGLVVDKAVKEILLSLYDIDNTAYEHIGKLLGLRLSETLPSEGNEEEQK